MMLKRPLSDAERAQIRFLLRALGIIVIFVILASLIAGTIVSLV